MNVEAQAIDVPTGAQDYRPAYYGGISAVELGVNGVRRVALDVRPEELQQRHRARLHQRVAQLGHQQLGRHQAPHRRRHRRAAQLRAHPRHRRRDAHGARAPRLARGRPPDRRRVGEPQEARARRDHAGDRRHARGGRARPGALGGKVCGAGGGGCLFCFAEPDDIPAVRQALADAGARVLDFTIEARGLRDRHLLSADLIAALALSQEVQEIRRLSFALEETIPPELLVSCRDLMCVAVSIERDRVDNLAIARVLAEIGDLLEIKGENPFKIRAYRNAAETIVHETRRVAGLTPTSGWRCRASARTSPRRSASWSRPARSAITRHCCRSSRRRSWTCCASRASGPRRSRGSTASSASARLDELEQAAATAASAR